MRHYITCSNIPNLTATWNYCAYLCMLWILHSLPCTMYLPCVCVWFAQNGAQPILRIKPKIRPHFLWWRPNAMAKTILDLTMFYVYDLWAVLNLWALAISISIQSPKPQSYSRCLAISPPKETMPLGYKARKVEASECCLQLSASSFAFVCPYTPDLAGFGLQNWKWQGDFAHLNGQCKKQSYQANIISKVYLLVWASKAELECTQKDDYSAAQEMKKEIDLWVGLCGTVTTLAWTLWTTI